MRTLRECSTVGSSLILRSSFVPWLKSNALGKWNSRPNAHAGNHLDMSGAEEVEAEQRPPCQMPMTEMVITLEDFPVVPR
jgi:hypothetical protein